MERDCTVTQEQWASISQRLQEPFEASAVDFRVQGKVNEQTGRAQVVAYIDARSVQDRLDAVVGAGNWSFDWTPLVIERGEVMVAKGTLSLYGVSKSDAGSASNFEQSLGAVSHCFKRAAVHWGIGRYLYSLPMSWVTVEKNGRIPDAILRELRAKLPRPSGHAGETSETSTPRVMERVVETEGEQPGRESAEQQQQRTGEARRRPSTVRQYAQANPAGTINEVAAAANGASGATSAPTSEPQATEQQLVSIRKLCGALGRAEPEGTITYAQARQLITQLSGEYQRVRRAS